MSKKCKTEGCKEKHWARGYCKNCYNRNYQKKHYARTLKEKVISEISFLKKRIKDYKKLRNLCRCDSIELAITLSGQIKEAKQEIIDLKNEYYLFFERENNEIKEA